MRADCKGVGHGRYFRRRRHGYARRGCDIGGVKSACPERFNVHTLVLKVDNAPGKGVASDIYAPRESIVGGSDML